MSTKAGTIESMIKMGITRKVRVPERSMWTIEGADRRHWLLVQAQMVEYLVQIELAPATRDRYAR